MPNCFDCETPLKDYRSKRCNPCRAHHLPMVFTDEVRLKMSRAHLGKTFSHSSATRRKMSEAAVRNANRPVHNKPHSEAAKQKMSENAFWKGKTAWNYIADRSLLKRDETRGTTAHRDWSISVKKRDAWKCKIADSNCDGRLESHHILGWKEYPELRYKVNNGIALCHAHHPRRRAEEKRLVPRFLALVSVSK